VAAVALVSILIGSPSLSVSQHQFHAETVREGATVRLELSGELDLATEPQLTAVLRQVEEDAQRLVLDLSGLSFIDSTGLRTILLAWRRSRDDGFELSVIAGSAQVRRTLRLTGLDEVLPVADQ
jgi:anti-anti-sigma factor